MALLLAPETPEIIDLAYMGIGGMENPDDPDPAYFIYGERTAREVTLPSRIRLEFPDVSKLDMAFGDPEERRLAADKIRKIKETLVPSNTVIQQVKEPTKANNNTIKLETLPTLDSKQVLELFQQAFSKDGVKEWIGTTREGRTIKLTVDKEIGSADINLTFAEMYMLKVAVEILKLKELEIVYRSNKPGSTKGCPVHSN